MVSFMASILPLKQHLTQRAILQRLWETPRVETRRQWTVIYLLSHAKDRNCAAEIAKQVGYTSQWVRKLAHAYNRDGVAAIDKPRANRGKAGRPGALDDDDKNKLRRFLQKYPDPDKLSLEKICAFLQWECGLKVSRSTACRYRKLFKEGKLGTPPEAAQKLKASAQGTTHKGKKPSRRKAETPKEPTSSDKQPSDRQPELFDFL